MTARPELPACVVASVLDHVHTLEQLELLTMLRKSSERWWDAATVADVLRINPAAAGHALEHLASHNLLAITITTAVRYRFQPGTAELRDASEAFAEAFRTDAVSIVRLVTDTQRRAIRDFADAFRIRRHDDR